MINIILNSVFNFIISVTKLVLLPIDLILEKVIPDTAALFSSVNLMFESLNPILGFVLSISGLSKTAISFIVLYYTFKLTVPLAVHSVKFVIKWYNVLKP